MQQACIVDDSLIDSMWGTAFILRYNIAMRNQVKNHGIKILGFRLLNVAQSQAPQHWNVKVEFPLQLPRF